MNDQNVATLVKKLLAALEKGVAIDWTDTRVYLVILVASGLGSVLGAYFQSFFGKRGEITAIREDLDQIKKLQEEIKASVSRQLWINQSLWTLKRETYWKLTSTLSLLSSQLFTLLLEGYLSDKSTLNSDPRVTLPLREAIEKRLADLIALTAPSHIVLSQESVAILTHFHDKCGDLNRQLVVGVAKYDFFADLKALADNIHKQVIEFANRDLRAVEASHH